MNLSRYVKNFLFLNTIEGEFQFDAIVYLGGQSLVDFNLDSSIPVFLLPKADSDFVTEFQNLTNKYHNILCIVDELTISFLKDLDPHLWHDFSGVVVNLYTGLSSFGHKVSLEINDVVEMNQQGFDVLEAYDLGSFLKLLQQDEQGAGDIKNKKYIRLVGVEIPSKLLQDEHERVTENRLLSMDKFGLGGESATLLTSGNYLGTVVQTAHILNEQKIFVDVYAILNYDFKIRDDLKNSVARTEKLIVILDHKKNIDLEKMIISQFPLQKGLEIKFIYPEYEKITAYMDEYRPDQARFDQVGLMERVLLEKLR